MRALGAPRAHVLHARALSRHAALPPSSRPVSGPYSPAEPRHPLALSPVPSKLSLAPCCAAGHALGGTPASAAASAMFGTAQATSARQLPQSTGRAYPPARRHAFVAATMPCYYRKVVAGDLIPSHRGPTSSAYLKGPRTRSRPQATSDPPRRASLAVD